MGGSICRILLAMPLIFAWLARWWVTPSLAGFTLLVVSLQTGFEMFWLSDGLLVVPTL